MAKGLSISVLLTRRGIVTLTVTAICLIIIALVRVSYAEDATIFGHSLGAIKTDGGRHSWYHDILLKLQHDEQEKSEEATGQITAPTEPPSAPIEPQGEADKPESAHNDVAIEELPGEAFGYHVLESISSADKKYWKIDLSGAKGYNANLIPHPTDQSLWILVLQRDQYASMPFIVMEEMTCNATFTDGKLKCTDVPEAIQVKPEPEGVCPGDIESYKALRGPRDARMFYGPNEPYLMFGAQSSYVCLGLFVQDIRPLLSAFPDASNATTQHFGQLTELKRPSNAHPVEKNYFLFWDSNNVLHAQYDLYPRRAFARVNEQGVGVADLATSNVQEEQCLKKLIPEPVKGSESIHQATNSLRITMCSRYDQNCVPNDSNTYIMHIFQHKLYYGFHANYRPYVILFKQSAPFAVHAVGQRPYWINGRGMLTMDSDVPVYNEHPEYLPHDHTEFFYVTSMSWKTHGQQYHGYMDDPIFLTFGIEDARGGVIDVLAKDLLQDLAYC